MILAFAEEHALVLVVNSSNIDLRVVIDIIEPIGTNRRRHEGDLSVPTKSGKNGLADIFILDLVFCYSSIEYSVTPMTYPKCGKIPLIIRLYGLDELLLWYYPQMTPGDLAVELESLLQGALAEVLCMSA